MKNASGARSANPFLTDPGKWAVTIAQVIRAVQRTEQMMAPTKEMKKNHFMPYPRIRLRPTIPPICLDSNRDRLEESIRLLVDKPKGLELSTGRGACRQTAVFRGVRVRSSRRTLSRAVHTAGFLLSPSPLRLVGGKSVQDGNAPAPSGDRSGAPADSRKLQPRNCAARSAECPALGARQRSSGRGELPPSRTIPPARRGHSRPAPDAIFRLRPRSSNWLRHSWAAGRRNGAVFRRPQARVRPECVAFCPGIDTEPYHPGSCRRLRRPASPPLRYFRG